MFRSRSRYPGLVLRRDNEQQEPLLLLQRDPSESLRLYGRVMTVDFVSGDPLGDALLIIQDSMK